MVEHIQTGRSPTRAQHALVTSPHYLASSTGVDILRNGGSAVDAAIAVNATLCVVYPHMAGLGGDGFWLIADEDVHGLNASGPAATSATKKYYQRLDYDKIPDRGSASALTVPGAVDGWRKAHNKYGNLEWARLFKDAITYAREGVVVTANLNHWISMDAEILKKDPQAKDIYLIEDNAPEPGSIIRQPDLADTISIIAQKGSRKGFYEGVLAERICDGIGSESPLSPTDFAHYSAEWVNPISVKYRDYTAYSLPPNTQGIAALQILGILDKFDVKSWGHDTADYYHYITEAVKIAFSDRDAWVTDPKCIDFPKDKLLSSSYLNKRKKLIKSNTSLSLPIKPGYTPDDFTPNASGAQGDTCYVSIVDDDGLAVSMLQSIYHDFGSGIVAEGTGIIPQNRGASFVLNPDHINSLKPGKRTFHTLIPSMLTYQGRPYLMYGTMGGEGQPQTQAALITRIIDFGFDVQSAIEAPRWLFGRTWGEKNKSLSLEGRISDGVFDELQRRGHPVTMTRDFDSTMGHAAAIRIEDNGHLEGGADPRGDGSAIGF